MTTSREIHLAARPRGIPEPSDFALVEVDLPNPGDGELLIRNAFVSVDPYMRGRMNDAKSYVPSFGIGEPWRCRTGGVSSASTLPLPPCRPPSASSACRG
jgi:NADPH-dependent curcumin reductase CurA